MFGIDRAQAIFTMRGMQTILFLCTGNYYRSRYAEEFFNHHAERRRLAWRADSRGLAPDMSKLDNPGPMSAYALATLACRGIAPRAAARAPATVQAADVAVAQRIVALCEREHRPMLQAQHRSWMDQVEYLHVDDIGFTAPTVAMAALETALMPLLR